MRLLVTAALWVSWCAVHSLLTEEGVIGIDRVQETPFARYYRFLYVCFAVASLSAVFLIVTREGETGLWCWEGPWRAFQLISWVVAIAMGYLSFRFQDVWGFLGFRALFAVSPHEKGKDELITYGIYGMVRHPQFAAGVLFLWTRDLTDTGLVTNLVLTAYLILGSKLEERKLVAKFGDRYRRYRQQVPAFIPGRLPRLRYLLYPPDQ